MPLLYGEGSDAFGRLQAEILRSTADLSIFAWNSYECPGWPLEDHALLAQSSADFVDCSEFARTRAIFGIEHCMLRNNGLELSIRLLDFLTTTGHIQQCLIANWLLAIRELLP
jgi:hypothetical protein